MGETVIDFHEVYRVVEQCIERTEAGAEIIHSDTDALGSELMQQGQGLAITAGQIPLLESRR